MLSLLSFFLFIIFIQQEEEEDIDDDRPGTAGTAGSSVSVNPMSTAAPIELPWQPLHSACHVLLELLQGPGEEGETGKYIILTCRSSSIHPIYRLDFF